MVVEPTERRRLERLDGVEHRLVGPERAELDRAEREVHHDEHDVDERDRRLEEVVDVAGDELAELVDEPAEPRAAEEGDERPREGRQIGDREDDRDRHHQRTPDRVRDVERAVPELRVAGEDEEEPVPEHRADRAHEERVETLRDVDAAQREPRNVPPVLHRFSVTRPARPAVPHLAFGSWTSSRSRGARRWSPARHAASVLRSRPRSTPPAHASPSRDATANCSTPSPAVSRHEPVVLPAELGDVEGPTGLARRGARRARTGRHPREQRGHRGAAVRPSTSTPRRSTRSSR